MNREEWEADEGVPEQEEEDEEEEESKVEDEALVACLASRKMS